MHIDGRELELSNLDKVIYPAVGFTKGEVIDYYVRVAPILLPHLRRPAADPHPLPERRGRGELLREERARRHAVLGAHTAAARARLDHGRETLDFIVVDEIATLAWLANMAAIELHTPQWRLAGTRPGQPGPARGRPRPGPAGRARRVLPGRRGRQAPAARWTGWSPFAKTSGKKGMQLLCRLPGGQSSDEVSGYAQGGRPRTWRRPCRNWSRPR